MDLLLVVVQILRLCAPFRQSDFASFVDFVSSLALLAVMLSLFSVFWRRLLQHYLVVAYCCEVRPLHLWELWSAGFRHSAGIHARVILDGATSSTEGAWRCA